MKMDAVMEKLIRSYGCQLILEQDGSQKKFRGFLQPLLSRQQPFRRYSPMGEIPIGRYLFIGPASVPATEGAVLIRGNRRYELRQAEQIFFGDKPIYCWGMCVEIGRGN